MQLSEKSHLHPIRSWHIHAVSVSRGPRIVFLACEALGNPSSLRCVSTTILALHCALQVQTMPSRSLQPVQRARRIPSLSRSPTACPGIARLALLETAKGELGERDAATSAPASQQCPNTAATATAKPTSCRYQLRCRRIGWGRRTPGELGRDGKAAVPSAPVSSAIPRRVQRGPRRPVKSKRVVLPSASLVTYPSNGAHRMSCVCASVQCASAGKKGALARIRYVRSAVPPDLSVPPQRHITSHTTPLRGWSPAI